MMRWIPFTLLLAAATLLNSGNLLNLIAVGSLNIRPDLLLIMMIFFAVQADWRDGVIAAFIIGLAADISGVAMGPHVLTYGLIGAILAQTRRVVIMKRKRHQALSIFVIALIAGVMIQLLTWMKTGVLTEKFHWIVLGTALYSALAGPIVWWILSTLAPLVFQPKRGFSRFTGR